MNAEQIVERAQQHFTLLGRKSGDGVTGLSRTDDGWVVSLEAVERKAIPDTMDVLGLYEIHLDGDGNLLGFSRTKMRKRGETREES